LFNFSLVIFLTNPVTRQDRFNNARGSWHFPILTIFTLRCEPLAPRASAENFPGRATEKRPKISKKYRKIALFASSREGGGNGKKTEK